MRFLIISDLFSLDSWILDEEEHQIMPAVYHWYQHLGSHKNHQFTAILIHPKKRKTVIFPNGSKIEVYPLRISPYYFRKFISLIYLYRKALALTHKQPFDIVYGMAIYSIIAKLCGRQRDIYSVARIFGSLVYDTMQKGQYLKLYTRFILQYLEIRFPANLIICTEDGTQFDLARQKIQTNGMLCMLYNGIDSDLRRKLLEIPPVLELNDKTPIRMLSVGRLTGWKRHDLSIRMLKEMQKAFCGREVTLTILGKGKKKSQLMKLAKSLKLHEKVKFMDPVGQSHLPDILGQHQIFLSFYDASNLSNAMWEAAISGRLICTRPTGKTKQVFHHFKNCLMAKDLSELSQQLKRLSNDQCRKMTETARNQINQLIPDWPDRFEEELGIITDEWTRSKNVAL